jgi:hypothetical protein
VSDDYGAYRSIPGIQQLCWAHLYRTIRDTRYNDNLPDEQLLYVTQWYESSQVSTMTFEATYASLTMKAYARSRPTNSGGECRHSPHKKRP